MSAAEILFNDSMFALLPGQGMFVRSQVTGSEAEGRLEGGGETGFIKIISGWGREEKETGGDSRMRAGILGEMGSG